ncbi:MAG: PAS domain S-box protein [Nitrospirae bacterium]|nr:PAS domain S-box protein [Nitrospirota bacterium]
MLRRKKGALWLGVGLSAFYWVADSVIDAVFYHEGTITSLVFSPSVHEISTRLMALILITSVVYTSVLVYKYKKAVKTLEKTTQTLQSIFQASPVAIIVLNPEQKVIMWSPAAERIFGWSEREVIGKFNPIVPEDKKDEFKSFCERIMRGEFFSGVEIKRQRTDRKRIEEELKKSEGKLKAIIETEPECVKLVAADGTLMEMNPAGLCMIEADSIEQVRGKSVYGIMDPEFCEQFKQLIEDVFKGDSRSLEFKITGLKGTQRWLDTHAVPFRSAEGEIIAVLAITRDTTERKKMEEQIFQIQHDWEDTFNIITDMITVHDKDFNIIHANKAAEKILGLPILPGKKAKCYKYYHGTECPPEGCPSCQTLKTGKSAISEIFEPHLNKFIEIRAIPRFDSNNNLIGLIHVVRDIT